MPQTDLSYALYTPPLPIAFAVSLLRKGFVKSPALLRAAFDSIRAAPQTDLLPFLCQIVQALRHDALAAVSEFAVELGGGSEMLCHQLLWVIEVSLHCQPQDFDFSDGAGGARGCADGLRCAGQQCDVSPFVKERAVAHHRRVGCGGEGVF
jgi:hypothetical protein